MSGCENNIHNKAHNFANNYKINQQSHSFLALIIQLIAINDNIIIALTSFVDK